MPRFYFDVRDPRATIRDDVGVDLSDGEAARHEAMVAACEMIESLPPCEDASIALSIRDEGGRPPYEVCIAIRVTKH